MRTPLAGIKAAVSTLRTPGVTWSRDDEADLLAAIEESADRLGAIIANLLDLTRLQTGAVNLVTQDVGLDDIVARTVRTLPDADRIDVDLAPDLPAVRVDVGLLERVTANLVENALRYSARPARVEVTAEAAGTQVRLRVIDHGPGIAEHDKGRLFQPFQRLGDAPAGEGVGLGLAVAAGLTTAVGGQLSAHETPGGGLTMVVDLPAAPSRHLEGPPATRTGPAVGRHPAQRAEADVTRILVVDDDPAILRTLAIGLRAHGYEPLTAADGRSAVALGRTDPPDLVILDLGLPDISGVEVLRQLRTWSQVPVIVLSARDGSEDKVEALDVGADDYVTKPFGMDELLARLRAAVRRSGADQGADTCRHRRFASTWPPSRCGATAGEVRLTPTEWGLLQALVTRPGRLVSQRQLLHEVWGPAYATETHYLRVYMGNLRRKLEPEPSRPRYFITEPGMGYRYVV